MRRAFQLAAKHRTHPNPRVGAVVLDHEGEVIGEGAHAGPGQPHAEAAALTAAGPAARGGTVIVTLEPCTFFGRTPPCVDALIGAGVARVVVGAIDPDIRVAGQGIAALRRQGLEVETGVLARDAEDLDPAYFHHRRTGRPRVTLKAALTLDGQLAASDRSSQWITAAAAREDAHRLRSSFDAVMVGSGTVIHDDPRLDVRLPDYSGPQPRPIVLVGAGDLPPGSKVLQRQPLLIAGRELDVTAGALRVSPGPDGRPMLDQALTAIAEEGYLDILVEGGARLAAALWQAGLVDRGVFYLGGRIAGGKGLGLFDGSWRTLEDSIEVDIVDTVKLGSDLRVDWVVARNRATGPRGTSRNGH
jgi:diaminohydroxyphosphoribosylaminopyrimidine deaminase/5-amino-6-(5-phosphoribosylamino)uracil reductase